MDVTPQSGRSSWWFHGLTVFLLLLGSVAFLNALDNPFIMDDIAAIRENPSVRACWPIWSSLWAPWENPLAGRPIPNYSFAVNYAVGKLNPRSYHAVNLMLHVLCAWLVYLVTSASLRLPRLRRHFNPYEGPLGLVVALVWLVHPLQTEVINYVTQRTEILMGLFFAAAVLAAIRAYQAFENTAGAEQLPASKGGQNSVRGLGWEVASAALCSMGMLCKESMITAPVLIALHDFSFRDKPARQILRERWRLYVLLALSWTVLAYIIALGSRSQSVGFGHGMSMVDYSLTQCWAIGRYLWLTIWPADLLIDYGIAPVTSLGKIVPGLLAILLLLALTVVTWRWNRPLSFAILAWFVTLSPTSSFVPIVTEVGAERRVYVPLMSLIAAIICCLATVLSRTKLGGSQAPTDQRSKGAGWLGMVCVTVIVGALSYRTFLRNTEFRTARTLCQRTVEIEPRNVRALTNLAVACVDEGDEPAAIDAIDRSFEIDTRYAPAWYMRGNIQRSHGDLYGAQGSYERAIELDQLHAEARNSLGVILAQADPERALRYFEDAIQINPLYEDAINNLGLGYFQLRRFDEADQTFHRVLNMNPRNQTALIAVGIIQKIRRGELPPP